MDAHRTPLRPLVFFLAASILVGAIADLKVHEIVFWRQGLGILFLPSGGLGQIIGGEKP